MTAQTPNTTALPADIEALPPKPRAPPAPLRNLRTPNIGHSTRTQPSPALARIRPAPPWMMSVTNHVPRCICETVSPTPACATW
eukprot:2887566-Rhodomonas_salina.2